MNIDYRVVGSEISKAQARLVREGYDSSTARKMAAAEVAKRYGVDAAWLATESSRWAAAQPKRDRPTRAKKPIEPTGEAQTKSDIIRNLIEMNDDIPSDAEFAYLLGVTRSLSEGIRREYKAKGFIFEKVDADRRHVTFRPKVEEPKPEPLPEPPKPPEGTFTPREVEAIVAIVKDVLRNIFGPLA